jgi:hypothetical protein
MRPARLVRRQAALLILAAALIVPTSRRLGACAVPLARLGNDIASPSRSRRENAGESRERVTRRREDRREPRHEFHRGHHAMPSAPPADVLEAHPSTLR